MTRHFADRPRVVSVIGKPGIRFVPVGEQRRPGLYVGPHKRLDRSRGVVRDGGETDATGPSVQVFRPFPPWLGLVGAAVDHLDGAGDEDLPGFGRIEKVVVGPEGNFGLVDLDYALQRLALGIDHRSSQLLRQQPGGLVCDAELRRELECRHAVRVGCHEMRGPEPHCQRQFGPVHHCTSRDRRLTTAAEAFVGVRPAPQQRCAALAAGGTDKPLRPTPLEQKRRTARLVGKTRWNSLRDRALATGRPLAPAACGWPRGYYTSYGVPWDSGVRRAQSAGYDGCIYPSAMGSGKNYALFDVNAAKAIKITHVRVKSAAFFSAPLSEYEPIYDEGPYDYM